MRQADFFKQVVDVLESLDVTYMVVGSLASSAYGDPRATLDIDIVIKLIDEDISSLCRAFPESDFYISPEAARAAMRAGGQFNLIHAASGHKVDFIISRNDLWGRHQIARRRPVEIIVGQRAYAASPEDVVLAKMLFHREGGSDKHLRDIAGILRIQGKSLDREYIARWAIELKVMNIWNVALKRMESP